jgi:hypothetical protein
MTVRTEGWQCVFETRLRNKGQKNGDVVETDSPALTLQELLTVGRHTMAAQR